MPALSVANWWLMVALFFGSSCPPAQTPSEHQIKAAYVYNFTKFIEWPTETFQNENAPYIIGVLNDDAFSEILEQTVKERTVNGRRLAVKRLKWRDSLQGCHILYISAYGERHLEQIFESIKQARILTIGESDRFLQRGGMLNLVTEENRVLFEINTKMAERVGLRISSKLLALAKSVK